MSQPLRIEFPNAWYHVMSRGSGYRDIFCNDNHRMLFLDLLSGISKMLWYGNSWVLFNGQPLPLISPNTCE